GSSTSTDSTAASVRAGSTKLMSTRVDGNERITARARTRSMTAAEPLGLFFKLDVPSQLSSVRSATSVMRERASWLLFQSFSSVLLAGQGLRAIHSARSVSMSYGG